MSLSMKQSIQIRCKNNKKTAKVEIGSTLYDVFHELKLNMPYGPVNAKVNNKIEGMHYRLYHNKDVEFLDLHSPSALRAYTRTLFFVLCKAVHDLYPHSNVVIDIPVSNGYYVDLDIQRPITPQDADAIRRRMQEIIAARLPISRHETTTDAAIAMFKKVGDESKVRLLETVGTLYTTYYELDHYVDYYYGSLLTNTRELRLLLLRVPSTHNPAQLGELVRQDKMFEIFKEHHRWQQILGIRTVGDFNKAVANGFSADLVHVSEALQEKKIARIADEIAARPEVRMVLLAGPSSSGKTTTCKRLSVQLLANGIRPVQISLDDYFVNREHTPKDANGEYDYESLYALNIPLLNEHLAALFRGEEVQMPKYNFVEGRSEPTGKRLHLPKDSILVVEGIHALNPELTALIPAEQKYKVYASALTTILLDNHNYIPTTDNRLLRRIVRDHKYRGVSAAETIKRWPSVRAGETKWIFPYQEEADAMFNTAMLFELAIIKTQAEPLLEQVPENCDEYSEAYRLRKFLRYFAPMPFHQLPPTSLLREFLGGSSFSY